MNVKNITISILIGLFLVNAALLTANAQYIDTTGGGQIYVNKPYNAAQPSYIVPPTGMAPTAAPNAVPNAAYAEPNAAYAEPNANFAQQPYSYTAPYTGAPYAAPCGPVAAPCAAPLAAPCGAPLAAPVAPCGPFTSGFTYGAQQASAFGPFTPPVSEAAEQFYQFPGLTPYGPYPGAGYAATGGVGFDPMTGYYGPYGGVTPLV
jgi:hypothetical protein